MATMGVWDRSSPAYVSAKDALYGGYGPVLRSENITGAPTVGCSEASIAWGKLYIDGSYGSHGGSIHT